MFRIAAGAPRTAFTKPKPSFSVALPAFARRTPAASSADPMAIPPERSPPADLRFADIGINLSDPIFRGVYHGKRAHDDDLDAVVQRARAVGVRKMMVTGSDVAESEKAVELARQYPGLCYATVGVHPCTATAFTRHPDGPDALLRDLAALARRARDAGTAAAFGEIGLDYDRLQLADRETQVAFFEKQLDLACELGLPLFLHSRAAAGDFERILGARVERLPKRGVVHSFTGSVEEMRRVVALGFDVGINGCSMKTEENVAVVRAVPLDRLQIETDGPWCEMRPSHASAPFVKDAPPLPKAVKKERWSRDCMVKGRNEPCAIVNVAYAVARIKELSVEEVCESAWRNSIRMFTLGEPITHPIGAPQ